MQAIIFTDGSSRGNPGPGGWSAVVIEGDPDGKNNKTQVIELGGREGSTTNNRMELTAAARGLAHVSAGSSIVVYSDSSYVINGITKWIYGWKRSGWRTNAGQSVLNKDLWMELESRVSGKQVSWKYVGGHAGILGNERCDRIATAFADNMEVKLYNGPLSGYDLPDISDISHDAERMDAKKSDRARTRAKAHSYVSMAGGIIEVHHTWSECEKRVKGVKGARFKKTLDAADEESIIREFESSQGASTGFGRIL